MISNNGSIDIASVATPFEFLLSSTLSVFFPRAFEKKNHEGAEQRISLQLLESNIYR